MLELRNVTKHGGRRGSHPRRVADASHTARSTSCSARRCRGKTSLMRLMAGLDTADLGRDLVRRQGRDRRRRAEAQRGDGLPAVHQLPGDDRVREHRLAACACAGCRQRRDRARGRATPRELLHLGPISSARRCKLSGGQQQRAALARPIVKNADLVLLDEPLANLDYKLREELRAELPTLVRRRRLDLSSTPPPSRTRRCCSAAPPPRSWQGRVTQFGPSAEVVFVSRRDPLPHGADFSPTRCSTPSACQQGRR